MRTITYAIAQNKVYRAVNSAIVEAYWEMGEQIYKECGESDRAEYGKSVLKYLSERLTTEFGKGFTERALRQMRRFYMVFPIRHALRTEFLTWTHYRLITDVENPRARGFYVDECIKSGWITRKLERQIHSFFSTKGLWRAKATKAYATKLIHWNLKRNLGFWM